jgi:hypothetical protein
MSRDTAKNAPYYRLTRVLSGSMLFHLGNKCLQSVSVLVVCVAVFHRAEKKHISWGSKPIPFKKEIKISYHKFPTTFRVQIPYQTKTGPVSTAAVSTILVILGL